jgi:hypothetical protein
VTMVPPCAHRSEGTLLGDIPKTDHFCLGEGFVTSTCPT